MGNVTTYVTDLEIEAFFKGVTGDPAWAVANIPVLIRGVIGVSEGAAFNQIKERMDYVWCDPITDTKTLYYNGENKPTILVEAPITQLDEVTITDADGTETTLLLTGTTREVFWDPRTGKITVDKNQPWLGTGSQDLYQSHYWSSFPEGTQNIKVIGQFGAEIPAIAKLLEIMIMYKMLQFQQPAIYKVAGNLVREKIGRYEYQLGVIGFDHNSRNMSLDAYIDYLFDQLPKINTAGFEAV